jgi:hypothetical protein
MPFCDFNVQIIPKRVDAEGCDVQEKGAYPKQERLKNELPYPGAKPPTVSAPITVKTALRRK